MRKNNKLGTSTNSYPLESRIMLDGSINGGGEFTEAPIAGADFARIWRDQSNLPFQGETKLDFVNDGDDVSSFSFTFNGEGGSIGRVDRSYYKEGIRVDDTYTGSTANIDTEINHTGEGNYYAGLYGWVTEFDEVWENAGNRHEFYIVDSTGTPDAPLVATFFVDGVEYDLYRDSHNEGPGYRFTTVRKDGNPVTNVNTAEFFQQWRAHGMPNGFLHSIGWGIELLGGYHEGSFSGYNVVLPDFGRDDDSSSTSDSTAADNEGSTENTGNEAASADDYETDDSY